MKVKLKSKLMPYWHIQGVQTGKIYDVFEITSHSYRIIAGDDNKPYLYDKRAFDIIDFTIPHDWVYNVYTTDIGEIYHDQDILGILGTPIDITNQKKSSPEILSYGALQFYLKNNKLRGFSFYA